MLIFSIMTVSPVFAILQQTSLIDYPGRMAAVLFLSGCNFRCGFCHNYARMADPHAPTLSWAEVQTALDRFQQNWVSAAVISGGEPTRHPQLPALVEMLRDRGFSVKLDTNGSRPDVLEPLLPHLDYVAMDVKCAPRDYFRHTGFGDLEALTASIGLIRNCARDYEFRTTILEAWHDEDQMEAIGRWVQGARLHVLQAFVPREDLPDPACRHMRETPIELMHPLADILRRYVARVEIRGG